MNYSGLTKHEVEVELLSRVDVCRAIFERLRNESIEITQLSRATIGNPDGVLSGKRSIETFRLLHLAQDNYMAALRDFSHFIISGTLPDKYQR